MIFTRSYNIPYFNVGADRKLRITSLMQYLEDMAIRQSEECGIGLDFYEQTQTAWVLAKWDLEVNAYPAFTQDITITTEPHSFRNYFGFRRYEVRSSNDKILAKANTLWVYIDMRRKRPTPVTEEVIQAFGISPDSKRPLAIQSPEPPDEIDYQTRFHIRLGDIDTNQHVNNIRYIEWALETLPPEFIRTKKASRVMADYRKELMYGDEVYSTAEILAQSESVRSRHKISNSQKDACLAVFEWNQTS